MFCALNLRFGTSLYARFASSHHRGFAQVLKVSSILNSCQNPRSLSVGDAHLRRDSGIGNARPRFAS